jgi:hypothetical protein
MKVQYINWVVALLVLEICFGLGLATRVIIKMNPGVGNGGDIASSFGTIKRSLPQHNAFAVEVRIVLQNIKFNFALAPRRN